MPTIPRDQVTITLEIREDDTPVRGNLLDSGDPDEDKREEDAVLRRLEGGDAWAWCCVRVVAEYEGFRGVDVLCGCSYADEKDFRNGPYFADMIEMAVEDLEKRMTSLGRELTRLGFAGNPEE